MGHEPSRLPARWLGISGLGLGLSGAIGLFLPVEAGAALGWSGAPELPVQVAAAGLLAMANLNWLGRGAVYGGIYGRPIVVANLTFGVVVALVALSAAVDGEAGPAGWGLVVAAGLHALVGGRVLRGVPAAPSSS